MRKLSAQIVELERVNTSHLQQDEEIRNMNIAIYQDDVIIPTARERLFAGLGINIDNEDSE